MSHNVLGSANKSLSTVLKPAGLEASKGLITALYMKEVTDPKWRNDKGFLEWGAWMKKYYPEGALDDQANGYAYNVAILMPHVLKQCGNDLSRENIMRQAASIKDLELPLLILDIQRAGPSTGLPTKPEQADLLRLTMLVPVPTGLHQSAEQDAIASRTRSRRATPARIRVDRRLASRRPPGPAVR